jgi:hypothetical protein
MAGSSEREKKYNFLRNFYSCKLTLDDFAVTKMVDFEPEKADNNADYIANRKDDRAIFERETAEEFFKAPHFSKFCLLFF